MNPDRSGRTYVIAEMAWGHNGSVEVALELVRGAKLAGADAISVHVTSLPDYMVPHYRCADGVTTSDRTVSEIYQYLERLNLSQADWLRVFAEARRVGIDLCVMCNDGPSLDFVRPHHPDAFVLAAACFTEFEFIRAIGRERKPVILRVGGATLAEIDRALAILKDAGAPDVSLLHGIQLYPTDIAMLNIRAITTLQTTFRCNVGLADHIDGGLDAAVTLPLLAVALGASAIEKHITVDRALKHEDFEAALGLVEFKRLVDGIRQAEAALGDGRFGDLTDADLKYRRVSRKRVVARQRIPKGSKIAANMFTFKRADHGLDPGEGESLIGRTTVRDVEADEGLDFSVCG